MKAPSLSRAEDDVVARLDHQKAAYQILAWFKANGPATFLECERALKLRAAQRISELKRAGCLRPTGTRRRTSAKSTAAVYAYVPGSSFVEYLGLPAVEAPRRDAVDEAILDAGRSFVDRWVVRGGKKKSMVNEVALLVEKLMAVARSRKATKRSMVLRQAGKRN